jgi:nucleotide-binding universal stress UspA family protein
MYKKILVPLDGSLRSEIAAEHAVELAKCLGAEVVFFHVVSTVLPYVSDGLMGAYQQIHDELHASGEEIIKKASEKYGKYGVRTGGKMIWGDPAAEICREAEEGKYDLIVLGSRGLGEIKGYLIGSVSNRVVKHAGCPVVVVR